MLDTRNLNLLWSSLIVEELIRQGFDYFVVSPGSRSAPLTVAVAQHPQARSQLAYDERAAAFFALGYAKACGKAAVLICTSGSAAAHYYPALIEASQDHLPMLILSADRPPELLEAGANQAIRQQQLYGDYPRWSFNLPCPSSEIPASWLLSTLDLACERCSGPDPGPVHLNLPFREPLAPAPYWPEALTAVNYLAPLQSWRQGSRVYRKAQALEAEAIQALKPDPELLEALLTRQPGLLILGRLTPAEQPAVLQLAQTLASAGWTVFADILSGLRLDQRLSKQIAYYDQLLANQEFMAACEFETVLQIGRGFVSGKLLKHLAARPPARYLQLCQGSQREDPNHQVSYRYSGPLQPVCQALDQALKQSLAAQPEQVSELLRFSQSAEALYAAELDQSQELSEPGIARLLAAQLPQEQSLLLGNSLCVRELDGFASLRKSPPRMLGSRGTSGIDGHLATAAGFAAGSQSPITLLCGDLTFLHDLNSLYLVAQSRQPLTLIVVNNQGGGIFSFLPIAQHQEVFEDWFGTPHQLSFEASARQFGLNYFSPDSASEFLESLQQAWQSGHSSLIELRTERHQTLEVHRRLQRLLDEKLAESA